MTTDDSQEPPLSYGLAFLASIFAISGLGTWLSVVIVQALGIDPQVTFLTCIRALLTFAFLIVVFPLAISVEVMYCRWKRRSLRPLNILVAGTIVAEALLAMTGLSLVLEFTFPGLSFSSEPFSGLTGLAIGVIVGGPVVVVGLTSRIPKIREYVKKAFE